MDEYSYSEKKRIKSEQKIREEKIRTMKLIKDAYEKAKLEGTVKTTIIKRED